MTFLLTSIMDLTLFGIGMPAILVIAGAAVIYFLYIQKGGSVADPLAPLKEGLDAVPTETGRPALDKVIQVAATHFKDNAAMLFVIHKEAEELAAILAPATTPAVKS